MKYTSIWLLGILGGLAGVLIGAGELLFEMIFWGHLPGSWLGGSLILPEVGALLFILLGIMGMISSLLHFMCSWVRLPWAICSMAFFPNLLGSNRSWIEDGWLQRLTIDILCYPFSAIY
jgi:hypothetical protein